MSQSPNLARYDAAIIQPSALHPDQLRSFKAALLNLGCAIGDVEGVGLLVVNLHADNFFFEKLSKLTQYFSLAPALAYPLGSERPATLPAGIEALDTQQKHGWLGGWVLAGVADEVFKQAGLNK